MHGGNHGHGSGSSGAVLRRKGARVNPNLETRSSDEATCADLLPRVSRTFALSIEALPAELATPVRTAYLLCRIVDTVEDERPLDPARRRRLFAAFDHLLLDDRADPRLFERRCAGLGETGGERTLCRRTGAVVRTFRALPHAQREAIRPHVLEMSQGMRAYAERADAAGGLRLRDVEDLERYCYFVAGTVGLLLTALFEQTVPPLGRTARRVVHTQAVHFGLGLQLVNILKDVAGDLERGDVFLPERLAADHEVPLDRLLDPALRPRALGLVRDVARLAERHLDGAKAYALAWPADTGAEVRLFCAVPLTLALATLDEIEDGRDVLRPGRAPKVSRERVFEVLQAARDGVRDDAALARLFASRGR